MTKKEFQNISGVLTAAYDIQFDTKKLDVWYSVLHDLDYEKIKVAVDLLMVTERFMPNPAIIREAYFKIEKEPKQVTDILFLVNNTISQFGRYRVNEALEYIRSKDNAAYLIIKAIGFNNLCNGNPNFIRSELEKLYTEAIKQESNTEMLTSDLKAQIAETRGILQQSYFNAISTGGDYY